jgi:probable F420-dependent oxidoreductase
MKFWQSLAFSETDDLVELASICEQVGFHGITLSDHVLFPHGARSRYPYSEDGDPGFVREQDWPDPWALVSAMAQRTERIRFATAVYILPLRHPFEVARSVATASLLSQGRVALGVGMGWLREEFELLGRDFATRGRRADEMIEILRALWRGGPVEHHGEFFDFGPVEQRPAPKREIPVYVGGVSPAALRRVGRLGDGWIGSGNDVSEVKPILDAIALQRTEAGRDRLPFESIVPVTNPPTPEVLRALEDAGATGTVSYPLVYTLGPGATLDQKRAALERYAEGVIAKANA